MDQTLILIEDLNRTIGDMYKGTATVTWYTNESNASIWEIRGHKKELVVMLHYENGCKEANEIIDTEDTVFIKEEPRDVVNVCHQNESAQDIECTEDAEVVVRMSDADNPTCQPTKDYSLRSTTCTSSEEAVSVQSTTFNDVSNEEAVSHSHTHMKSSVDTDLVADKNSIPDVLDSTSPLIKVEYIEHISQSTRCNGTSTEEAIPRLDMVCSITEHVSGERGYSHNVKSESNDVIIGAKINYGQSYHSNGETVLENKKYISKKTLEVHEDTHNGINSYKCSLCNKEFNLKANLKRHMVIHSVVKPFQCLQCNKQFNTKHQLKLHEASHSGVRPFECSHCNKKFNWKHHLLQHEVIHSVVKPFECAQCNTKFSWKSQLKRHEATHSGVKSHECSLCKKTFYLYDQLRRHIVTHSASAVYRQKHCQTE